MQEEEEGDATQQAVSAATALRSSRLGLAVVAGNVDMGWAERLYRDVKEARPNLPMDATLHLLYLVTPYDLAKQITGWLRVVRELGAFHPSSDFAFLLVLVGGVAEGQLTGYGLVHAGGLLLALLRAGDLLLLH